MSRRRERIGRHESVAGQPADATLRDLVAQFTDKYAFIRELLQNSLDAGAVAIDIEMEWRGDTLTVAAIDDGDGMDRDIIEGYLLTLFRSTKEEDLTKIGKFGIGFVSLFAMAPRKVVVDTGRDGIWHRIVFDEDRSWTLHEMEDPFEGTTVTLHMDRNRAEASKDCDRVHAAAMTWCRFADAEIHTTARGVKKPWDRRPVSAPFDVKSPVTVSGSGDGWRAVVGVARAKSPSVGFYNHGITLWEGRAALVPGATFRVEGRHLEHTLTRDNVRRDRHFDRIVAEVRALAEGPLVAKVRAALVAAARDDDLGRVRQIFRAMPLGVPQDEDLAIVPAVGRSPLTLAQLRPTRSWVQRLAGSAEAPILDIGPPEHPLVRAVAASGRIVLAARSPGDPHVKWLARYLGGEEPAAVREVQDHWCAPRRADPTEAVARTLQVAAQLAAEAHMELRLWPALFAESGAELAGHLAWPQRSPYAVGPVGAPGGDDIMIDVDHPLVVSIARLPPHHAAPLLLRAVLVDVGRANPGPDAWMLSGWRTP